MSYPVVHTIVVNFDEEVTTTVTYWTAPDGGHRKLVTDHVPYISLEEAWEYTKLTEDAINADPF